MALTAKHPVHSLAVLLAAISIPAAAFFPAAALQPPAVLAALGVFAGLNFVVRNRTGGVHWFLAGLLNAPAVLLAVRCAAQGIAPWELTGLALVCGYAAAVPAARRNRPAEGERERREDESPPRAEAKPPSCDKCLENVFFPTLVLSPEGRIENANGCFLRMIRRAREEVAGRIELEDLLPPDDRPALRAILDRARSSPASGGGTACAVLPLIPGDGEAQRDLWIFTPAGGGSGTPDHILCMGGAPAGRDKLMREAELRLTMLANAGRLAGVGAWEWDAVSGRVYVCPEWMRIHASDVAPVSLDGVFGLVHADDRRTVENRIRSAPKNGARAEFEYRAANGERWIHCAIEPVTTPEGNTLRIYGACRDVTGEKRWIGALHDSEVRFRNLFESAPDAMFIAEPDSGRLLDANRAAEELTGRTRDEIRTLHFTDLHPPEFMEKAKSHFKAAVRETGRRFTDALVMRKDGVRVPVEISSGGTAAVSGRPMHIGIFRDVSERLRAEADLRRVSERFRLAQRSVGLGIWEFDLTTGELHWDGAMRRLYGFPEGEKTKITYEDWAGTVHPDDIVKADFEFHAALEGLDFFKSEFRIVPPGGDTRHIATSAVVERDSKGRAVRVTGLDYDITERKRAEERRRDQERAFREILESVLAGYWDWNLSANTEYLSPAFKRMFGYEDHELPNVPESWQRLIFPEDLERVMVLFQQHVESRGDIPFRREVRYRHRDGSTVWVICAGRVIEWAEDGSPVRMAGCHVDITDLKRMEMALRVSEDKFSKAFRAAPLLMTISDVEDGRYLEINDAFARVTGYSEERALGSTSVELGFISPNERNRITERLRNEGRVREMELELTRAGGERMVCLYSGELIEVEGKTRLLSIGADITRRKRAEEALRKSEERFRAMLDGVEILPVQGYDSERRIIYWNAASERVYGYGRDEAIGRKLEDLVIPDAMREEVVCGIERWKNGGPPIPAGELVLRGKNGEEVNVYSSHMLHEPPGGGKEFYCVDVDLKPLRRAERERELLISAIEQTSDAIVITDAEARIQYVNPAFERITGYPREEAMGQNPRILKSGDHGPDFYREMWTTLTAGRTWSGRMVNRRKDGSTFTEAATISPVRDGSEKTAGYVSVKRDITERLELEEQLRQAQKMESVGRLAGGVAHDFNNLLTIILGHATMAADFLEEGHPARASFGQIAEAGERAAALTRQLLAFSRKQYVQPLAVDVNQRLAELQKMIARLLGEDIELSLIPSPDTPSVQIDPTQFDQIFINLTVNARDAMPAGGTYVIRTERITSADGGDYAKITFKDSGTGIAPEHLPLIFDPFFTTKETGKGTGLGLSTVHGIVSQNGGRIEARSEPGAGAEFALWLPAAGRESGEEPREDKAENLKGSEFIVLVEDEAALRNFMAQVLDSHGFRVEEAGFFDEAVQKLCALDAAPDLLVTDIVLPRGSGVEIAAKARERFPEVRVLLISGYSDKPVLADKAERVNTSFLQKPFTHTEFMQAIRRTLDGPPPR